MNGYGSSNVSVRLALANIRKKKKNMIIMTLFIILAAMTLSGAVTLINSRDRFFGDIAKAQNLSDFCTFITRSDYRDEFEEFLENAPGTSGYEKELELYMPECDNTTVNMQLEVQILDLETPRTINTFIFKEGYTLDECEANGIRKSEAVYIPSQFKGSGCDIGGDYTVVYKGTEFHFKLAGYYDSAIYANTSSGSMLFYVPHECFESLRGQLDEAFLLKATLKDGYKNSDDFILDFKNNTSYSSVQSGLNAIIWSSSMVRQNIHVNIAVGAVILIIMSVAVMAVVFAVICSEISESIRDSYKDIGVLEAMGYHSGQISASYLIQYGVSASGGSVIGSLLSVWICDLLAATAFTTLLGFSCGISANPAAIAADILTTTAACVICVLFSVARIRKCTILTALRGGIETHSFKGNFFPLHKGGSDINTRMGLKNLFTEKRQNIMIGSVVFLCMVLIGISACIYNTFKDTDVVMRNAGIEISDLQAVVTNGADTDKMIEEITALPEFRKAFCSEQKYLTIDGRDVMGFVTADYSVLENIKMFEGDAPVYENEIALSENLCTLLGKDIGDTVTVSLSGTSTECFITGKSYIAVNSGLGCFANESLLRLLRSDYRISSIDLYFSDGVTEEQAVEALSRKYKIADRGDRLTDGNIPAENTSEGKYSEAAKAAEEKIALLLAEHGFTDVSYSVVLDGEIILSGSSEPFLIRKIENRAKSLSANLMSISGVFFIVSVMMLVISVILTAGILSMMVRNRVSKKRSEYGVFKAMGYTASDLMKQNALSYAVSASAGAILGIIVVLICAGPMMDVFFLSLLGSRIPAVIDSVTLIGSGIAMVIFVFAFSLICSRKIKNISVYSLMTE